MKDESGMVIVTANKFKDIWAITKANESYWENYAKYHLRQVMIAEIKAKLHVIQDITRSDVENGFEELTSELQAQLAEAEKESQ